MRRLLFALTFLALTAVFSSYAFGFKESKSLQAPRENICFNSISYDFKSPRVDFSVCFEGTQTMAEAFQGQ